eukprot:CAMPEP_0167786498 /NCGR_PEP_ID=MMETSP0111_2-20121227/8832_1 /TAXON_ID=91324 /ORGANISM="Lotharella globosa, Strain CCCM811" /LENGTH=168 /DNA_ID=CAMNT_0007677899 /DNA_START=27 /DNA_END=533 /DNA_ORIENTATION=+
MASQPISGAVLSQMLATGVAGVATGALAFVSFVDTRTYLQLVENGKEEIIKGLFPRWWPNGRDMMVSVIGLSVLTHGTAFYLSRNSSWLWSGGFLFCLAPYTMFVLGEDIDDLMRSDEKEVSVKTRRFCWMHHPRLILAALSFSLSLFTLGTRKPTDGKVEIVYADSE